MKISITGKYGIPWELLWAALFAVFFVILSSLSGTWLVLIFLGVAGTAAAFWSGNIMDFLLKAFVLTCGIDISKALIVKGGIYAPGLSLTLSDICFTPLFVLWLFDRKIVKKRPFKKSILHSTAIIFLLWTSLTAFTSQDIQAGILALLQYLKYYAMFFLLCDFIRTPKQIRSVLAAFALGLSIQVTMVGLQFVFGSALEIQGAKIATMGTRLIYSGAGGVHVFRPSGFLNHPNMLADYLVFLLPTLVLFFLLGTKRIGPRAWWMSTLLMFAGGGALIVSLSRGGWIAFTLAALFVLFTGYRKRIVTKRHLSRIGATALVIIIAICVFYPQVFLRITQRDQRSAESRVAMNSQALLIIRNHPFLGTGLGGYNRAARTNIPHTFSSLSPQYQEKLLEGIVHNKYLLTAAESGLPGLFLFMLLLWRSIRAMFLVKHWIDPVHLALATGITGGLVGQTFFYLLDHFYIDIRIQTYWLFLGLLSALLNMQSRPDEQSDAAVRS